MLEPFDPPPEPAEPPYVMGFGAPVTAHRYHQYRAGLLSPWEIVVLYQDMIEANQLPSALVGYANNLLDLRLCRIPDAMTYH